MTTYVVYCTSLPSGRSEARDICPTFQQAKQHLPAVCAEYAHEQSPNSEIYFEEKEITVEEYSYALKYDKTKPDGVYFLCRGTEIDVFVKHIDIGYVMNSPHVKYMSHIGVMVVEPKHQTVEVVKAAVRDETHTGVITELERVISEFWSRRENRLDPDLACRPRASDALTVERYTPSDFVRDLVMHKRLLRGTDEPEVRCAFPVGRVM